MKSSKLKVPVGFVALEYRARTKPSVVIAPGVKAVDACNVVVKFVTLVKTKFDAVVDICCQILASVQFPDVEAKIKQEEEIQGQDKGGRTSSKGGKARRKLEYSEET